MEDGVVIRTMQDDLKDIENPSGAVAVAKAKAVKMAKGAPEAPEFPLKPKGSVPEINKTGEKVDEVARPAAVVAPEEKEGGLMRKLAFGLVGLVVLAGLGAGALWWMGVFGGDGDVSGPAGERAHVNDMVPDVAELVLGYNVASATHRNAAMKAWEQDGRQTKLGLLEGNPTVALGDADIDFVYYIKLAGESKPYALVPATSGIQDVVSQLNESQYAIQSGWIIAHQTSTQSYLQALESGSGGIGIDANVVDAVTIFAGGEVARSVRLSNLGPEITTGSILGVNVSGNFVSQSAGIQLTGVFDKLALGEEEFITPPVLDQQLLSAVPGDASMVHMGADLAQAVEEWQQLNSPLSQEVLDSPQVKSLLDVFRAQFAAYIDESLPGESTFAAVVALPRSLEGILVPNSQSPEVEAALKALTPLVTGRETIPPVAFTDFEYKGVAIRYVNFPGPSKAIDYAVVPNYLLIATSREGMFNLIDTHIGEKPSVLTSPSWQRIMSLWQGGIPNAAQVSMVSLEDSDLANMLPKSTDIDRMLGVAIIGDSENTISAIIEL